MNIALDTSEKNIMDRDIEDYTGKPLDKQYRLTPFGLVDYDALVKNFPKVNFYFKKIVQVSDVEPEISDEAGYITPKQIPTDFKNNDRPVTTFNTQGNVVGNTGNLASAAGGKSRK